MDDEGVKIHLWPIEDVFDQFNPAGEKGLTQQRADQLLEQHGPNELEKPPPLPVHSLYHSAQLCHHVPADGGRGGVSGDQGDRKGQ